MQSHQLSSNDMSQILRADGQVWVYLAQNIPDVRPLVDGTKPLDKGLDDALNGYDVTFHLLPCHCQQQLHRPSAQQETEETNLFSKGMATIEKARVNQNRTSRVQVQHPVASKALWEEITGAELFASITICQSVQMHPQAALAGEVDMFASRRIASKRTLSARPTRTKCPRPIPATPG